jgi:tetratricopeptide (TPR) repeat protein
MASSLISLNRSVRIYSIIVILLIISPLQVHAQWTKARKFFQQADMLMINGEYGEAISNYFYGCFISLIGRHREVWDDMGFALLQKGDLEKAKDYLKLSIPVCPENYNPRFYLAVAYLLDNEIEEASEQMEKIESDILFNDSWIEEKKDHSFEKSNGRKASELEIERIRKEKGIWLEEKEENKIIIHLDAFDEKNEKAFRSAQEIVNEVKKEAIKADDSEIQRKLEQVRTNLHHRLRNHRYQLLDGFIKEFFKVLRKGKIDEAIDILETALSADEQSFNINYNLALLYFDMIELEHFHVAMLEKAEIYCARVLWFKDYFRADKAVIIDSHELMGNIYFTQKKYEKAKNEFEKILEIDPSNDIAHYNIGSIYYKLNDERNAEKEWKKAIECEKEIVKTEAERASEEEKKFYLTVVKKPVSPRAHIDLGSLYLEQDLIDKAIIEFKEACALDPHNPKPFYKLGKISQRIGDKEKAMYYYEKYLYLGGKEEEEVKKILKSLRKKEF